MQERTGSLATRTRSLATLGLVVWAIVACFARLGEAPVYILNEAREGVYVRAMLASGNFVLPPVANHVENGEIIPDKPPLFHWVSAASMFGRAIATGQSTSARALAARFDEWSLRFPSALAGCLAVLALATLGRRLVGDRGAVLAAAALLASWQFIHQARFGRVDMALATCLTIALLLLGRAVLDGSSAAMLIGAAWLGLAVLAKGPLAIVLVLSFLAPYAAIRLYDGSWRRLLELPWVAGALIVAAVAVPWYAAAFVQGGAALLRSQLLNENLHQFGGGNGRMALLYYVVPWLTDSLPWNLLALIGAWQAWRTRHPGAIFCSLWWLSFLVFFELAAYKRRAYLLPALPAASLLAGWLLDRWLPPGRVLVASVAKQLAPWRGRLLIAFGLALVAGALLPPAARSLKLLPYALGAADGAFLLTGLVVALVASLLLARAAMRRDAGLAVASLWGLLAAVFVGVVPTFETITALQASPKALIERIDAALPPGQPLTVRGVGDDPSLLLLLYASDPDRLTVIPERTPPPAEFPPGFYLFAEAEWQAVSGPASDADHGRWRELLRDELRERAGPIPLVLAERLT